MTKSKFSLPDRPAVDSSRLEAFAAGADGTTTPPKRKAEDTVRALRVGSEGDNLQRALATVLPEAHGDFDPEAKPTYALNVRLNAYELALLRLLARAADRSQHWIVKNTLVPSLEEAAQKLVDS